MPAPGLWKPNRLPHVVLECAGGNFGSDTQGLDATWKATPAARIAEVRRIAAGITNRLFAWMVAGWLVTSPYFCVTCSDVLQTNVKALFEVGGPFAPLPGEEWTLYTGGGMPLSGGVAVETLNSQASGNNDTRIKATAANAAFVADCVRFFGAKGFSLLAMDACDEPADDAMLEAVAAVLKTRGQFRGDGSHVVMSEPVPVEYFSGDPADNRIRADLILRRPWYMLERNFVRERDPYGRWRFDPARTEVHVKIDAQGMADYTETTGIARLNDLDARGMIIDWGGGPAWAERWWRNRYGPVSPGRVNGKFVKRGKVRVWSKNAWQ